ncbi:hypothetical protein [Shewanella sp. 0m-4]
MEIVDRIIAGSIAAISGAFSAYIFNKLNWQETTKKNSILSMEEELLDTINSLAETALEYWSSDQKNLTNSKLLEAKIKMNFNALSPAFRQLAFTHGSFSSSEHTKITTEISRLFEHATGGKFESNHRVSSPKNCLKISNSCNKIKASIRKEVHT